MTKLTEEKRAKFFTILSEGGTVMEGCRAIDISRQSMYARKRSDGVFSDDWDVAYEEGTDSLEVEATRRAKESSDTLLIFLLKGRRPEKYRDRFETVVQHNVAHTFDLDSMPLSEIETLAAVFERAAKGKGERAN